MKQSEFKQYIRAMVPSATEQRINNALLESMINKGVREVNYRGKVLRGSAYFDATTEEPNYVLATEIPDYADIGESGVWYNRGSVDTPFYDQLDGVSRSWLDQKYPNWVNSTSGNPQFSLIESGLFIVYAAPEETLVDGFWLPDYIKKPVAMTNDAHYPFTGSTVERADLEPLDDAIITYVRWILREAIGDDQKGLMTRKEFEESLRERLALIRRRSDFMNSQEMRG